MRFALIMVQVPPPRVGRNLEIGLRMFQTREIRFDRTENENRVVIVVADAEELCISPGVMNSGCCRKSRSAELSEATRKGV